MSESPLQERFQNLHEFVTQARVNSIATTGTI
jgi:hypothetical protein